MNHHVDDSSFENLLTRAAAHPFFDLESALCTWLETRAQKTIEQHRLVNAYTNFSPHALSIAKIFSWPGEERCVCLRKVGDDRVFIVDHRSYKLSAIESDAPALHTVEPGNRILILNAHTSRHLSNDELCRLIETHAHASDLALEQELQLRAHVNAREEAASHPGMFAVIAMTV